MNAGESAKFEGVGAPWPSLNHRLVTA